MGTLATTKPRTRTVVLACAAFIGLLVLASLAGLSLPARWDGNILEQISGFLLLVAMGSTAVFGATWKRYADEDTPR